jgi:hypothetical protein
MFKNGDYTLCQSGGAFFKKQKILHKLVMSDFLFDLEAYSSMMYTSFLKKPPFKRKPDLLAIQLRRCPIYENGPAY